MVKITQIITAIKAIYPIAHDSFTTSPPLPFVCWTDEGDSEFFADNKNYLQKSVYNIELYTKLKSKVDEKKIQDILLNLGISYSRNPTTKIPDENCFSTVFTFELID